jgi:small-conductance mechanosensitive channel
MPQNATIPSPAWSPAVRARGVASQISTWFAENWLHIALSLAAALAILAVLMVARRAATRLRAETDGPVGWRTILGRLGARTRFWFLVLVALRLVDSYADTPPLLSKTIGFLFTIGLTFQAALWARELILGFVERRANAGEQANSALTSAMGIIRALVTVALFAVALILMLGNIGVNVAGLVAGLGIGGIAIGLAAQGIFADLFAGFAILFDRPFHVGDTISYGTTSGTVEAVGMKSTRIRAFSGELIVISNKFLLDKEIQNVSQRDHIRLSFMLAITHETPPDRLGRIPALLRGLGEAEAVTVARAGFESFGPSSFDYSFILDVPGTDWDRVHATRDRLLLAIVKGFAEEGIRLAYPTQTSYTAAPDGTLVLPYGDPQPGDGHGHRYVDAARTPPPR